MSILFRWPVPAGVFFFFQLLLLSVFPLVAAPAPAQVEGEKKEKEKAAVELFSSKVRPVLAELCFECHGPDKQKGDVRLDTLKPNLLERGADVETWHDALDKVNLGEMPPPKAAQPTARGRWPGCHDGVCGN